MQDESIALNGIDGESGGYLLDDLTPQVISKVAQGQTIDKSELSELKNRAKGSEDHFGPAEGIDPMDLAQAGWGVIFAFEDNAKADEIKEALGELLQHRRQQAGDLYKEYSGPAALRPGENKSKFLARHGMGPGPAQPDRVPYYLLLVGSPESIPYSFQYQLDVQYAVGRIHFDKPEDYANYARSVVESEAGNYRRAKEFALFGVQNNADRATQMSARELIAPLGESLAKDKPAWAVSSRVKDQAFKADLRQLLTRENGPALLFTASHGMGFPKGSARQRRHQGALLCQDWPGPIEWRGRAIPPDHYFSADDITADARLGGLIAFHFACFGAGTPKLDDFARQAFKERAEIAEQAFLASLPTTMLSHPKGGALAAVGHVERAWGCSFVWQDAGRQLAVFESALKRLMEGQPVGWAMEYFNQRYAELSSDLSSEVEAIEYGEKEADDLELAGMWTANNDARSYVVIGDPAVRVAV